MKWWQRVLLNTVIFLVLANFLNGFYVYEWQSAVLAAVILSVLNAFVKPIITIFLYLLHWLRSDYSIS